MSATIAENVYSVPANFDDPHADRIRFKPFFVGTDGVTVFVFLADLQTGNASNFFDHPFGRSFLCKKSRRCRRRLSSIRWLRLDEPHVEKIPKERAFVFSLHRVFTSFILVCREPGNYIESISCDPRHAFAINELSLCYDLLLRLSTRKWMLKIVSRGILSIN